jgi:hypothetical protein
MMLSFRRMTRMAGVLGFAAGLLFGFQQTRAYSQSEPTEPEFSWWVDALAKCPASCDSAQYMCPCAVIHPH